MCKKTPFIMQFIISNSGYNNNELAASSHKCIHLFV